MKFKNTFSIFSITIILLSSSCVSYKNVPYFQDVPEKIAAEKITNYEPYTIHPGDILAIHLLSANRKADATFNSNETLVLDRPSVNDDDVQDRTVQGYLVDAKGDVHLPLTGAVHVAGITLMETSAVIEEKLQDYFTRPSITVNIMNFKISVLGDVKNPGVYKVSNGKVNFLEALALAGDLNITAIRTNVLLVRESNGAHEYAHIDLTSKKTINSVYYYLKNNDAIIVTPDKEKLTAESATFQKAALGVSALSLIMYLIIKR